MKHKHYDIILAKAANMELALLENVGVGWSVFHEDGCMSLFNPDWEYFLCLPQYTDACLHFLDGGKVQIKVISTWTDMNSFEETDKWSDIEAFTNKDLEIRIKPKKEKRRLLRSDIEHRPNGALIVHTRHQLCLPKFHVFKIGCSGEGELVPSPNGPWNSLDRARKDADEPESLGQLIEEI